MSNRNSAKLRATVPMSLMDVIPVLCFCISIAMIAKTYRSPLFLVGGILCVSAGLGKGIWKLILAISRRDAQLLNRQFRVLMPAGFACMLLGTLLVPVNWAAVWKSVSAFPGCILFGVGLGCMAVMMVLAKTMDQSSAKANWLEQSINLVAQLCILLGVTLSCYAADFYPADAAAAVYLQPTAQVNVVQGKDYILLDGAGEDAAIVFYPGAKVEYTAYSPIFRKVAESGVDCILVEMPYNMAMFGMGKIDGLMQQYSYNRWYLAGHSLGGAMGASAAGKRSDTLEGVILLAAYPTASLEGLRVLSVCGSLDGVINREKLTGGMRYMPEDAQVLTIEGGNHAQFGAYGFQSGDNAAAISAEEQWQQTADAIVAFVG